MTTSLDLCSKREAAKVLSCTSTAGASPAPWTPSVVPVHSICVHIRSLHCEATQLHCFWGSGEPSNSNQTLKHSCERVSLAGRRLLPLLSFPLCQAGLELMPVLAFHVLVISGVYHTQL